MKIVLCIVVAVVLFFLVTHALAPIVNSLSNAVSTISIMPDNGKIPVGAQH